MRDRLEAAGKRAEAFVRACEKARAPGAMLATCMWEDPDLEGVRGVIQHYRGTRTLQFIVMPNSFQCWRGDDSRALFEDNDRAIAWITEPPTEAERAQWQARREVLRKALANDGQLEVYAHQDVRAGEAVFVPLPGTAGHFE